MIEALIGIGVMLPFVLIMMYIDHRNQTKHKHSH